MQKLTAAKWLEELNSITKPRYKKDVVLLVDASYIITAFKNDWSPEYTAEAIRNTITATRLRSAKHTKPAKVEPSLHLTEETVQVRVESPRFSEPMTLTVRECDLSELCNGLGQEGVGEFKVTVLKED